MESKGVAFPIEVVVVDEVDLVTEVEEEDLVTEVEVLPEAEGVLVEEEAEVVIPTDLNQQLNQLMVCQVFINITENT